MRLTGAVQANDLAQGAPRRVTQSLWIGYTTFQLRGGHSTTYLSPPQRNLHRQCLGVRRCYDAQLGRYWENNNTKKRIELTLTIDRDFMQNFFIRFWEEGQYKPKTTGALTFLVCGRMSSLSFVQRTFGWDGWNDFAWRGRCRDWGKVGPQVSMPVNRERKKIVCPHGKMFWT